MNFKLIEIGDYHFVTFDDYVMALNKDAASSKEAQIENLTANYRSILKHSNTEDEAKNTFIMATNARKRPDWSQFNYDGKRRTLLLEDGYKTSLPLIDGKGERVHMDISLIHESDKEYIYSVSIFNKPQGTISVEKGNDLKRFFETFIGELCFHNTYLETVDNRYFPFSSKDIRRNEAFNFRPALHVIHA